MLQAHIEILGGWGVEQKVLNEFLKKWHEKYGRTRQIVSVTSEQMGHHMIRYTFFYLDKTK